MKKVIISIAVVCAVLAIGASVISSGSGNKENVSYVVSDENIETKPDNQSHTMFDSNKKSNQQIIADTVLDRQIAGTQYWLYNNSFTNGNDCIDKVYVFNTDPDTLSEDYENNYLKKYSYLYLNGKKDLDIQVQKYIRDDIDDKPWYCDQYFYIKSQEHKDKMQAYHSYEIGTSGKVYDNEYFCYTYDDNGRLTEIMDDVSDENYFYYDEQGVLERRTFYSTESNYDEKTYSYESEAGNIVKVYVYNAENGNTLNRHEYEYDSKNHITKETNYSYYKNEEKRIFSTISYSYDDNGNIIKIVREQYDSDIEDYTTTSEQYFYNDNNNISKIVTDNGKSIEYTVLVYTDHPETYTIEN